MDPESDLMAKIATANIVFTCIFIVEALIKIISYGFAFNGTSSYLNNGWNQIDFLIVLLSTVDIAFSDAKALSVFRIVRILRILRPIRLISRNESLKIAYGALVKSLPKIIKMMFLTAFFIFVISIVQVYLYSGQFYHCHTDHLDMDLLQFRKRIKTKWDCLNYGGEWIKPDFNFDDIQSSFLTLNSLSSTEGWVGVMWSCADVMGLDMQPKENAKKYFGSLEMVIIFFFISILFMNIFIGIVIETFNR